VIGGRGDAARRLRAGTNPVIGYIAFELMSAFTPVIANAIEREVARCGVHLLMTNDNESTERERSYVELFEMQRVSGLIIAPLGDIEAELLELKRRGTPSVLTDPPPVTSWRHHLPTACSATWR
jgi:LacI family transcriptional regulator